MMKLGILNMTMKFFLVSTFVLTCQAFAVDPQFDFLQMKMDSTGNALAVWRSFNTPTNMGQIQGTTYSALTTAWTVPVNIASTGTINCSQPELSVSTGGNAVSIWYVNDAITGNNVIQASKFNISTGLWSSPVTISLNDGTEIPNFDYTVAISPLDTIVVTWSSVLSGSTVIRSVTSTMSTPWSAAITIGP